LTLVLTSGGGTRVLCVGDSLTAQSDSQLLSDLGDRGDDARVSALSGSGLLDTKVNWDTVGRLQVHSFNPRVVVVEFIGNYGGFGAQPGVKDASPEFYMEWAAAAQRLEYVLASRGATVYWVVGPPVRPAKLQLRVSTIDHIYSQLRQPRTGRTVPLVDMKKAFAGPDGGFAEYLPDGSGRLVQVRNPDGTHLAPAGITIFSQTITDAVGRVPGA
jgi:hypothetical protein